MNKRIKEIALQNSIEVTWQEACYFGFFILLSVTKGLGLYEGQKLFELLVIPAFFSGSRQAGGHALYEKTVGDAGAFGAACGNRVLEFS